MPLAHAYPVWGSHDTHDPQFQRRDLDTQRDQGPDEQPYLRHPPYRLPGPARVGRYLGAYPQPDLPGNECGFPAVCPSREREGGAESAPQYARGPRWLCTLPAGLWWSRGGSPWGEKAVPWRLSPHQPPGFHHSFLPDSGVQQSAPPHGEGGPPVEGAGPSAGGPSCRDDLAQRHYRCDPRVVLASGPAKPLSRVWRLRFPYLEASHEPDSHCCCCCCYSADSQ